MKSILYSVFSPSTGGILSSTWQHFWVPFLSCVSGWAQWELGRLHVLTCPKPQLCKSAVAGVLEGQHLPAQPSPQLLPEAEFRRSQELSGSWRPLSYTKCLKLFPDSRGSVRPCVSQSEILASSRDKLLLCSPFSPIWNSHRRRSNAEDVPSFSEALRAVQAGKVLIESLGQRHLTHKITNCFPISNQAYYLNKIVSDFEHNKFSMFFTSEELIERQVWIWPTGSHYHVFQLLLTCLFISYVPVWRSSVLYY